VCAYIDAIIKKRHEQSQLALLVLHRFLPRRRAAPLLLFIVSPLLRIVFLLIVSPFSVWFPPALPRLAAPRRSSSSSSRPSSHSSSFSSSRPSSHLPQSTSSWSSSCPSSHPSLSSRPSSLLFCLSFSSSRLSSLSIPSSSFLSPFLPLVWSFLVLHPSSLSHLARLEFPSSSILCPFRGRVGPGCWLETDVDDLSLSGPKHRRWALTVVVMP